MEIKFNIPPSLEGCSTELANFIDGMVYKLAKNAHKGKWEDLDLAGALSRLEDEVRELEEAIKEGNRIEIILEAADIANFAMMVASVAIRGRK